MTSRKGRHLYSDIDDSISLADQILKDVPVDTGVEATADHSGGDSGCYDIDAGGGGPSKGLNGTPPNVPPLRMHLKNRPLNEKIVLNVGGKSFATYRSTLEQVPDTRLSDLDELDPSYDFQNDEYFFDRNPKFFSAVLDFYRTGELHFAHCLCGPSIKKELDYWGINDSHIANCCWRAYKSYEEEEETLAILDRTLNDGPPPEIRGIHYCDEKDGQHTRYCRNRRTLWDFLEAPQSSKFAQLWSICILMLILTSIGLVCMQTHPYFRIPKDYYNSTELTILNKTNPKELLFLQTDQHPALRYLDYVCVCIFSLELCLRLFACPSKVDYFKSFYNIIDIFCVVPMIIVVLLDLINPPFWAGKDFLIVLTYLSVTSVLRVFRLFKVAKRYRGLKILQLAARSSLRELLLLVLLIFMGMLIFSTGIYFAEFHMENKFLHIPIGFWWSIITMTTVGYGDFVPTSGLGYLVGGICAIAGMLATGLPIPIIASNFNHYYAYARYRSKLSERRARLEQDAVASSSKAIMESTRTTTTTVRSTTNHTHHHHHHSHSNKVSPEPQSGAAV